MKYISYLLLLFMVQAVACKKVTLKPDLNTQITKEPDFALIPTKDAKWYIHFISDEAVCYPFMDPADLYLDGFKDQLYHIYYVLSATGKTELYKGHSYHVYEGTVTVVSPETNVKTVVQPTGIWLREDTAAMKVYESDALTPAIDFSDIANQGTVVPFITWPAMNITSPDGYVLHGEKMKSWNMRNPMDHKLEYFYKAIGIGNASGILPLYKGSTAYQVLSLDFVYKGDSIHFDYPLH